MIQFILQFHLRIIQYKFTAPHFTCFVTCSAVSMHVLVPWPWRHGHCFYIAALQLCFYCCLFFCPKCKQYEKAMLHVNIGALDPWSDIVVECWYHDFMVILLWILWLSQFFAIIIIHAMFLTIITPQLQFIHLSDLLR